MSLPFGRTLSDSFHPTKDLKPKLNPPTTSPFQGSPESLLSPPTLPNLKPNRSDYDVFLPFSGQTRSNPMSQDAHTSNFGGMGVFSLTNPAARSQSAVYFDQLTRPTNFTVESAQRTLAMRRPPAGFNLQRRGEPRPAFHPFAAVRSVPASRCNSEEFKGLWKSLDALHISEEKHGEPVSKVYQDRRLFIQGPKSGADERSYGLAPHFDASFLDDADSHTDALVTPFSTPESFNRYQGEAYSINALPFGVPKMAGSQLPLKANFSEAFADSVFNDAPPEGPRVAASALRIGSYRRIAPRYPFVLALTALQMLHLPRLLKLVKPLLPISRIGGETLPSPKRRVATLLWGSAPSGISANSIHTPSGQTEAESGRLSPLDTSLPPTPAVFDYRSPTSQPPPHPARLAWPPSPRAAPARLRRALRRSAVIWPRRSLKALEAKFGQADFASYIGKLYGLCQDQPGCRYLQKTLEEGDPAFASAIFTELSPHFAELMTDPFGNYLSQKLMERASGGQRVALLHNAFGSFSRIAYNSHGTRALQKMIEILAAAAQSATTAEAESDANRAMQVLGQALGPHVVSLIKVNCCLSAHPQDSNGNHVIQKCITMFPSKHNQFVFDAISKDCLPVGTHKHGCCVVQRCFDHASFHQRDQLAIVIAANALSLVQDPYGNYVVQYVIKLQNCHYTRGLIQNFLGHMPRLSAQKFSSNVIELCIRSADAALRRQLIEEILWSRELEHLLQDVYANYVVQTCLDCAEPALRDQIVERIRPILLTTKSSPYTKRIQARILSGEAARWAQTLPLEDTAAIANVPLLAYHPHHGFLARPVIPPPIGPATGAAFRPTI
ncbi:hypothetical protein L0F63_001744 [Massospora cicadina]|nr:hypothetical protein L0F63_001744 [Massospora cicadina]